MFVGYSYVLATPVSGEITILALKLYPSAPLPGYGGDGGGSSNLLRGWTGVWKGLGINSVYCVQ